MKFNGTLLYATVLGLAFGASACSGGGGGSGSSGGSTGGSSKMFIVSCSLGCSSGQAGAQINCGPNAIFVNEELVVEFSQAVNLSTVTKSTFKVVNLATGKTPIGSYSLDPGNPKRLIFRPQVTFDSSGNPIFGLDQGASYQIDIPGSVQNPGVAHIKSTVGLDNSSRMFCTVVASKGINDAVPGKPSVTTTVDKVTSYDLSGNPDGFEFDVLADGAVDVFRDTLITLTFDDVMNPATLVNPVTGLSPTISVLVDPDGDVTDSTDQTELSGVYQINIDQGSLQTIVKFTPSGGLPSAGTGVLPRRIVVKTPATILDLGSNSLENFGSISFVPELIIFGETLIPDGTGEQFTQNNNEDTARSGALWGSGGLRPGTGGGSGRLGDLVVTSGDTLTLSTTSQVLNGTSSGGGIEGVGGIQQVVAVGSTDPVPGTVHTETITDGIYEFASVRVDTASVLRLTGDKAARVYARGEMQVRGLIDVTGSSPIEDTTGQNGHQSWASSTDTAGQALSKTGGVGGVGGAGGGAGGRGADRDDNTGQTSLLNMTGTAKGILNPGAVIDGAPGQGIGGGASTLGGGGGGQHWPPIMPTTNLPPPDASFLGFQNQFFYDIIGVCDLVGGIGAGGAFATDGTSGTNHAPSEILNIGTLVPFLYPPPATVGSAASIDPSFKNLDPELGKLVGGAGGGGGGCGLTFIKPIFGSFYANNLLEYYSHSAAGGGGGGGAVQLQAGRRIQVDGFIDASGGSGGDYVPLALPTGFDPRAAARPGGGGAGGGVLMQAGDVAIADTPGRVTVAGGGGGLGDFGTTGGRGGAGFVRVETATLLDLEQLAAKVAPYEPSQPTYGGADSDLILSTGLFGTKFIGPTAYSGAQSCWLRPDGNYFLLEFAEDDFGGPGTADDEYGWSIDVATNVPGFPLLAWREPLALLGGISLEDFLGSDLKGATKSPVVVRFQGARAVKSTDNLCSIDATDPNGPVLPESVTGWVRHPAELNEYFSYLTAGEAAKLRSNMIRFQIVFDRTTGFYPNLFFGVTNLKVRATPN
ncbi:MAG: hypothetical protein EPO68_17710 [Planctomycetota bacterium]|nr:MAG: hypothetical protein EPO68_17710 [Planctomycetota bacterium]